MTNTAQPAAPLTPAEDKQWAGLAHLLGILGILPSLIIWLVFRERGGYTNQEGKEALNFQITVVIVAFALSIVTTILTFVTFGLFGFLAPLLYVLLWAAVITFSIIGYSRVNAGGSYRYPVAIRFIK